MKQSVELQLNKFKQPRKLLLLIGLILKLLLVTFTMFNYLVFDSIVCMAKLLYHKRKSRKVFTSSIFSSHFVRQSSASELKNSGIYKGAPKMCNVRSISSSASKGNCNTTTISNKHKEKHYVMVFYWIVLTNISFFSFHSNYFLLNHLFC